MATIGAIREINIMMIIRQAGIMATIREIRIMATIIKRKTQDLNRPMRYSLLILAVMVFLAASGCSMFSSSRNAANDRDHPGNGAEAGHSSVLGQGENQGN
jgi:hypothetical protein